MRDNAGKRITLIANLDADAQDKISNLIEQTGIETCKVPYNIKGVEDRFRADTLPYHITVAVYDDLSVKGEVVAFLKSINPPDFKIIVDGMKIVDGKNNSHSRGLYLTIKDDGQLKKIQQQLYERFPNEKYNPNNFVFHITLTDDKDRERVFEFREKLKRGFTPFEIKINSLDLFEIYPAKKISGLQIENT